MRTRCVVPDCNGVIESPGAASPATIPCPECAKRVQLVPRLQEQIRALQGQLMQLQSKAIGKLLPLLKQVAKKPASVPELAAAVKRTDVTVNVSIRKLEERGLVTIAEFRRVGKGTTGIATWQASALGERIAHESNGVGGGNEMRKSDLRIRGLQRAA